MAQQFGKTWWGEHFLKALRNNFVQHTLYEVIRAENRSLVGCCNNATGELPEAPLIGLKDIDPQCQVRYGMSKNALAQTARSVEQQIEENPSYNFV